MADDVTSLRVVRISEEQLQQTAQCHTNKASAGNSVPSSHGGSGAGNTDQVRRPPRRPAMAIYQPGVSRLARKKSGSTDHENDSSGKVTPERGKTTRKEETDKEWKPREDLNKKKAERSDCKTGHGNQAKTGRQSSASRKQDSPTNVEKFAGEAGEELKKKTAKESDRRSGHGNRAKTGKSSTSTREDSPSDVTKFAGGSREELKKKTAKGSDCRSDKNHAKTGQSSTSTREDSSTDVTKCAGGSREELKKNTAKGSDCRSDKNHAKIGQSSTSTREDSATDIAECAGGSRELKKNKKTAKASDRRSGLHTQQSDKQETRTCNDSKRLFDPHKPMESFHHTTTNEDDHQFTEPESQKWQAVLQQAEALAADLRLHLSQGPPDEKHVELTLHLQSKIQTCYEAVILQDPEFASKHNIDQTLWKNAFYNIIEAFRGHLPGHQMEGGLHNVLTLIDKGASFYTDLLQKLQRNHQFDLDAYTCHLRTELPHRNVKLALLIAQRMLICLGDISRYREQATGSSNFGKARSFYLKAQRLYPNNGHPYNQLAILAIYTVFTCVWMVFSTKDSTKDRCVCLCVDGVQHQGQTCLPVCGWCSALRTGVFACVWMVFSTKDRCVCLCVDDVQHQGQHQGQVCYLCVDGVQHQGQVCLPVCGWCSALRTGVFACVWMVFSTKDRCVCLCVDGVQHQGQVCLPVCGWCSAPRTGVFACVWMVFSTKDSTDMCVDSVQHQGQVLFSCVWMVFSPKDRCVCLCVDGVQHIHVYLYADGVQHQGQRRKMDAVYFYMRSLAASNPFVTARESLMTLFEEVRRKVTQMEGKKKVTQDSQQGKACAKWPKVRSGRHYPEKSSPLRREVWILPPQLRTGQKKSVSGTGVQPSTRTPTELLKSFELNFLHTHGKLFTKTGMETFSAVVNQTLHEFQTLLQNSPSAIGNTKLLQVMGINMFAVSNLLKFRCLSDTFLRVLGMGMDMFGFLILEFCFSPLFVVSGGVVGDPGSIPGRTRDMSGHAPDVVSLGKTLYTTFLTPPRCEWVPNFGATSEGWTEGSMSPVEECAVRLGMDMFGLLVTTAAHNLQQQRVRESEQAEGRPNPELQDLLPSLKVWADWMTCHQSMWNPATNTYSSSPVVNTWTALADLCNELEESDLSTVILEDENREGLEPVVLEEDLHLAGFQPLSSQIISGVKYASPDSVQKAKKLWGR
ncbi:Smg-6, nonsense mediated mRNA decay factor [Branchiostoma belcheri]|nr:Smg-6, nonsense mediated mRNA decay factor [Branchiostoma belcheri]